MSMKPNIWPKTKDTEASPSDLPLRIRQSLGADYIPGYSETIMANDLAKSTIIPSATKEKYYRRDFGRGPAVLPVEFKWVRVVGPNGEISASANADAFQYTKLGFKAVKVESQEDFANQFNTIDGIGFPPAAQIDGEGMIRHRDAALFYIDKETADRLERERMEENKRFLGHNQPGGEVNVPQPFDFEEEETFTVNL